MFSRRSTVIIVLVTCFLFIFTIGCTKNKVETEKGQESTSSVQNEDNSNVVLKIAGILRYPDFPSSADQPVFQEISKMTGIKFEFELLPRDQYTTIMQTKIAANADDMADILIPPDDVIRLMESGVIRDLSGFIDSNGQYIKEYFQKLPEYRNMVTTHDGKIPAIYGTSGDLAVQSGLIYNMRTDWLKNLGLNEPATTNDWLNILRAMRDNDANGNGDENDEIPLTVPSWKNILQFSESFRAPVLPGDGFVPDPEGSREIKFYYIEPEFREALSFIKTLYDEKLLDDEFATQTTEQYYAKITNNIIGAVISSGPVGENSYLKDAGLDGRYARQLIPRGPSGNTPYRIFNKVSQGNALVISSKSKYPELAFKLIDCIAFNREVSKMFTWGIEGTSYVIENGQYKATDFMLKNPDGLTGSWPIISLGGFPTLPYVYYAEYFDALSLGNIKDGIITQRDQDMFMINAQYVVDAFPIGYTTSEETALINKNMTNINTYLEETIMNFILGNKDLDKFNEYVKSVMDMGMKEILEIKKIQYNRIVNK